MKHRNTRLAAALLVLCLLWALLPVQAAAADSEREDVVLSGVWGETAAFTLTGDGVFTVTGSGTLRDGELRVTYPSADVPIPAFDTLVVSEGIRRIDSGTFAMWGMKKAIVYGDLGMNAFWECIQLETVYVMNAEEIGDGAFCGCVSLQHAYLADSVKVLAACAFDFCRSLQDIRIPQKIMTLHSYTFRGCTQLKTVTMPAVQHVESDCFLDCAALREVRYAGTETQLRRMEYSPTGNVHFEEAEFILLPAMPDPFYGFFDMPDVGSWAYAGIRYCLENGYMNGMGNGYFRPGEETTRAQLVTILWRMRGEPKPAKDAPFSDCGIPWAADAIAWAAERGVVNGVGGGRFDPNVPVTREQLVTIFYRWCRDDLGREMQPGKPLQSFPDASAVSAWARDAMEWAVAVQFVSGVGTAHGPELQPGQSATRAQIARVIFNFASDDAVSALRWSLDREGILTITGSGAIPDYPFEHEDHTSYEIAQTPWASYQSEIRAVVIGEGITRIGRNAFCNAPNLRRVSLPSTLREIGGCAFYNDPIRVLQLPSGLRTIEREAFAGADILELMLPDSVTALGEGAFSGCMFVQEIRVSSAVTALPKDVFCNCPCLKTLRLPAALQTLHEDAFRMTVNLEDTYFGGTEAQWSALMEQAPGFDPGQVHLESAG